MKLFLLVVLFCILHHIAAQQYYVTNFYTTTSCSGTAAITEIVNTEYCFADSNGQNSYLYSCTNNAPTSVTYSGDTQCSGSSSPKTYVANQCNSGTEIYCSGTIPVVSYSATVTYYGTDTTCSSTNLEQVINYKLSTCISTASTYTVYTCSSGAVTATSYSDNTCTTTSGSPTTYATTCNNAQTWTCSSPESNLDDVYLYDDDGFRVSKYWSRTVITTFIVFFAFTWLMDMLGVFDQFIQSKAVLANHRMRLETGKLELDDGYQLNDGPLPETIISVNPSQFPATKVMTKLCYLIKYNDYCYCPQYEKALISERLYYTGDKITDLILYVCNYNAFLSMMASIPSHPFSRSQRRLQFLFYHSIALLFAVIFGYINVGQDKSLIIAFNIVFISPSLFLLKFVFYTLTVCPCLVGNRYFNYFGGLVGIDNFRLIVGWSAGLFGLFIMVITGATIFTDTSLASYDDDGATATQDLAKYGKKIVFDYMLAVFLTSYLNEALLAVLKFNFINGKSYKNPIIHIGKWHYEKEYFNSQQYLIDAKKTVMERVVEMYDSVKGTMSSIKNALTFEGLRQNDKVIDLSNKAIKSYIGEDSDERMSTSGRSSLKNMDEDSFQKKFLRALVPSPDLVADTLSGILIGKNEANKGIDAAALDENASIDRVTYAKKLKKRASATAQKCTSTGCNTFHYFATGLCAVHNGIVSKSEKNTLITTTKDSASDIRNSNSTRIDDLRADLEIGDHYALLTQLRSEMLEAAQTLVVDDNLQKFKSEAMKLLKGVTGIDALTEVERAQMLIQFRRLVGKSSFFNPILSSASEVINVDSVIRWLRVVDSKFAERADVKEKAESWIKAFASEIIGKDLITIDFQTYCQLICAYRVSEKLERNKDLNRYAFTDLRLAFLSIPTAEKVVRSGWLAKRGYFFAQENLNCWFMRYFIVEDNKLKYYVGERDKPGPDGNIVKQSCNEIDLLDIAIVDFSPKTFVPQSLGSKMNRPTSFKITTFGGKRMTLSGSRSDVISWVAYLSGFVASSRTSLDFREHFGTERTENKTIRDFIMLGAIICKITRGKKYLEAKGDDAKDSAEYKKLFELEETDYFYLQLFASEKNSHLQNKKELDEKDRERLRNSAEQLAEGLLLAIKRWNSVKGYVQQADILVTGGMAGDTTSNIIRAVELTVNGYLFTAAVKNRFNQNKYGVKWDSKMQARACAVCKSLFKSVSLRKAMRKHHCRCCGRVICLPCSPTKIEILKNSGKFDRICTDCVNRDGVPTPDRKQKNTALSLFEFVAATAKNAAAAFKEDDDNEDNDQSDDDVEPSETVETAFT